MNASRKHSWVAVAALTMSTILFGIAPQMTAADSKTAQKVNHPLLSEKQAKALAATAETRAEHTKLAAYYNSEADQFESEARRHSELADVYKTTGGVTLAGKNAGTGDRTRTAGHCDAIAKSLQDAAKSARELAAEHDQMAKDAKN